MRITNNIILHNTSININGNKGKVAAYGRKILGKVVRCGVVSQAGNAADD